MSGAPDDAVIQHIKDRGAWKSILYGAPHPEGVWDTFYCACEYCAQGPLKGQWRLCAFHSGMQEEISRGLDLEGTAVPGDAR